MTIQRTICAAAMLAATFAFGAAQAQTTEIKFGIGMPEGDSPEYQALKAARQPLAEAHVMIVEDPA